LLGCSLASPARIAPGRDGSGNDDVNRVFVAQSDQCVGGWQIAIVRIVVGVAARSISTATASIAAIACIVVPAIPTISTIATIAVCGFFFIFFLG